MQLVDSHCHLDFPEFADEIDGIVKRAGDAGIGWMVSICTHLSRFDDVRRIADSYDNVFCTVGIHPHEAANEAETSAEELLGLAEHPKVIGFGETGLDYYYEHSPREAQERSFRAHIAAAREGGLPIIVHTRDADDDTARILAEEYKRAPFSGLIHCFSAGDAVAQAALEIGFYISLSGIVTFKSAEELRDTVRGVPMDRILVETDAPYLAPVPKRGKRNEPAFTAFTAACVAELKGLDTDSFASQTTNNFFTLFTKAKR